MAPDDQASSMVTLDEELFAEVKGFATKLGTTPNEAVHILLRIMLKTLETAGEGKPPYPPKPPSLSLVPVEEIFANEKSHLTLVPPPRN